MDIWLGTHNSNSHGKVVRAAASDIKLRDKISKLATDGLRESPHDEPIKIFGQWEICRAEIDTKKDNIITLIDGNFDAAIKIVDDSIATYVSDESGDVKKKRGA